MNKQFQIQVHTVEEILLTNWCGEYSIDFETAFSSLNCFAGIRTKHLRFEVKKHKFELGHVLFRGCRLPNTLGLEVFGPQKPTQKTKPEQVFGRPGSGYMFKDGESSYHLCFFFHTMSRSILLYARKLDLKKTTCNIPFSPPPKSFKCLSAWIFAGPEYSCETKTLVIQLQDTVEVTRLYLTREKVAKS